MGIALLTSLAVLWSCSNVDNSPKIVEEITEVPFDIDDHLKRYDQLKKEIQHAVRALAKDPTKTTAEKIHEAQSLFSKQLVDSIFQYWYGTTWDFNGHTDIPRQGDVACGYFISTTLKHLGLPLNRFRIAQQASAVIVNKLCLPSSIKTYSSQERLFNYLETIKDYEVLILGLEYHVAFVVKLDGVNYLIHSDFANRRGVVKEKLKNAQAIAISNIYVIGNLTNNEALLKKWIGL